MRLSRRTAIALLLLALVACSGSTAKFPETAAGAGAALQAAGVFQSGQLHVSSAKDLLSDASVDASYAGVVSNVFSPAGDAPSIWQFKTVEDAKSAFGGNRPALSASANDYVFLCGSILVIGDTEAKVTAARTALAKHFTDCNPVMKAPVPSS